MSDPQKFWKGSVEKLSRLSKVLYRFGNESNARTGGGMDIGRFASGPLMAKLMSPDMDLDVSVMVLSWSQRVAMTSSGCLVWTAPRRSRSRGCTDSGAGISGRREWMSTQSDESVTNSYSFYYEMKTSVSTSSIKKDL